MRKSERLFQLVTLLQGRRKAMTGQDLAEKLGVGVRTVYRDIQALVLSGVPIDGEAGVGYRLRAGFDLPPLMFEMDEITALLAGNRMVQAWTDPELGNAARRAEVKILAVLTPAMRNEISRLPYRIPDYSYPERETHGLLRKACELRLKVKVAYRDMKEQESERTLWPLGLVGWGDHCLPEQYPKHPQRNLEHYLTQVVGVDDEQKPA
jgi:predicted DNA-binding transcriptional regulator YafY